MSSHFLVPRCVLTQWKGEGSSQISLCKGTKKAFLSEQYKEIEENNKMGKTRDLFKKIGDTKCIGDSVHDTSSLALHTAHTMPEPRAGKAQTKRLEDSGAM